MLTREEIEKLARDRANTIIELWWLEDTGEFQEDEDLTDEELEEVLKVDVMAFTPSDIEKFQREGKQWLI